MPTNLVPIEKPRPPLQHQQVVDPLCPSPHNVCQPNLAFAPKKKDMGCLRHLLVKKGDCVVSYRREFLDQVSYYYPIESYPLGV
jgi:hypothetical protein